MGTGCSRGWPSLQEPGNASLPHWLGGKGGGRLGSRALTLSPHLQGRRVPGPSLEQGRRPGLPLSDHLHAARRVNLEQLRGAGARLAPRDGRPPAVPRPPRPHKAVRGGTQACTDYSGSRRAARHLGAWPGPQSPGDRGHVAPAPASTQVLQAACRPPPLPRPSPAGCPGPPTQGQWQGHAEAAPPPVVSTAESHRPGKDLFQGSTALESLDLET